MPNPIHRELRIPLDTAFLSQVRLAVGEVMRHSRLPAAKANLIALAVDEAVANIIEHGFAHPTRQPGGADIEIVLDLNENRFQALIRDQGAGFDPRQAPGVDIKAHVKAGKKGGLGIFIMRRVMDEVDYAPQSGGSNELRLVKYIDEKPLQATKAV